MIRLEWLLESSQVAVGHTVFLAVFSIELIECKLKVNDKFNDAAGISQEELLAIENASDMHSSAWDSIHVHPRVSSCETRVYQVARLEYQVIKRRVKTMRERRCCLRAVPYTGVYKIIFIRRHQNDMTDHFGNYVTN